MRERDRVLRPDAERASVREVVHGPRDHREPDGVELAEQRCHRAGERPVHERLQEQGGFSAVLTLVERDHLVEDLLGRLPSWSPPLDA